MTKSEIRKIKLEEREKLSPEERETLSMSIQLKIAEMEEFKEAKVIYLYSPINNEPDNHYIRDLAYRMGKTVCLPVTISQHEMIFQAVDEGEPIHRNSRGLNEPIFDLDKEVSSEGLMLIPCVAFYDNYRLGYGGGYYDRFLAVNKKVRTLGVGYSFSYAPFETDHYDVRLDGIVTD